MLCDVADGCSVQELLLPLEVAMQWPLLKPLRLPAHKATEVPTTPYRASGPSKRAGTTTKEHTLGHAPGWGPCKLEAVATAEQERAQTSSRRRRGSSTISLMRFRNVTASRPSIRRWSYVRARFMIGLRSGKKRVVNGVNGVDYVPDLRQIIHRSTVAQQSSSIKQVMGQGME